MRAEHLYVHVPFCARRCIYCDFSIAVRSRVPVEEYVHALDCELARRNSTSDVKLRTLYVGGGTPSKLGPDGVRRMFDVLHKHVDVTSGAEITLEANPEDVTSDAVGAWRSAGVNRVSLGVQSFDDAVLTWMHRTHDSATARTAVHVVRDNGIANVSIDLILGVPGFSARSWNTDLESVLTLDLPHVSVYGLTVEPHTPLGRWVARQDVLEAPEEDFECEFLTAHHMLTTAGFEHYEVSNYAKPGRHSQHNWAYWRRRPYIGVGPSAHEFDGLERRWNATAYAAWHTAVTSGQDAIAGREELTSEQAAAEEVYLKLRTNVGLSLRDRELEHTRCWIDAGWAERCAPSTLRLTALGWLRLDSLASDLTVLRSR
jgi:oxygen-independent coproporphyrinogen-3 oxidase